MFNMRILVLACLAMILVQSISGQKVRSLKKQCVDLGFYGVCSTSTKNPTALKRCSQSLICAVRVDGKNYKQSAEYPPDGTYCGENKVCSAKKCKDVTVMPTVVGAEDAVTCGALVPVANKVTLNELQPLSP